jgi:hypothetical protein
MSHSDEPRTAPEFLRKALTAIENRASERDQAQERSMARTVDVFNALTDHALSEREGWMFMVCLKAARAQAGRLQLDDYTDGGAYFALAGESAVQEDE